MAPGISAFPRPVHQKTPCPISLWTAILKCEENSMPQTQAQTMTLHEKLAIGVKSIELEK
jgi:hypothetical protein